jgi:hypothetical protein
MEDIFVAVVSPRDALIQQVTTGSSHAIET